VRIQHPYYRPLDPIRLRRITNSAVPLGLGSVVLGLVLGGAVVYLVSAWATKAPLLAMTAGTEGALALVLLYFGFLTMTMRYTVSTGHLEMTAATALRRNLLVLWNFGMLLACLGCFTLVMGLSLVRTPTGAAPYLTGLLPAIASAVYLGAVAVFASRLLRG
jgi:phosphate starvation-inducible membrane PsiE